jgi:xylan 1,4-beta-xylosidase
VATIKNPILPGFHPDPSILRVKDDYFIATSSFEWYPGVPIYHSRDLQHWRLLTYALGHQLDLRGNPDSGGIWAPCLSHDNGQFYLIFTDVKSWSEVGYFKDSHNYLTTATDPLGPWSPPIFLNSSGFDPSLFHDHDGKKWLLNALWDHRKGKNKFGGIVIQEYDPLAQRLVGPVRNIFQGTALRVTEAPHLYWHDGWYHLMTAEGGTAYAHAVTMARSRQLFGPYQVAPANPLLTSAGAPALALQKAGHASLVSTPAGQWYIAHLCARPLEPLGRCNLGRETALQPVAWQEDGWLGLVGGGNRPQPTVAAPAAVASQPWPLLPSRDDFTEPTLGLAWNTLRVPLQPSWASLSARAGFLRLFGRESLSSKHRQSLVARRLQSQQVTITTAVAFRPRHFQQLAGLVLYYDSANYIYLCISHDESLGKHLTVITVSNNIYDEPLTQAIALADTDPDGTDPDGTDPDSTEPPLVHLRATLRGPSLRLAYSTNEKDWLTLPIELDAGQLSDEVGHILGFTGTFVGICVQDLAGTGLHADFDYFEYLEHDGQSSHPEHDSQSSHPEHDSQSSRPEHDSQSSQPSHPEQTLS